MTEERTKPEFDAPSGPAPSEAVHDLVAARFPRAPPDAARLVAYLHARAEGNPFYLGELLRTLEEVRRG